VRRSANMAKAEKQPNMQTVPTKAVRMILAVESANTKRGRWADRKGRRTEGNGHLRGINIINHVEERAKADAVEEGKAHDDGSASALIGGGLGSNGEPHDHSKAGHEAKHAAHIELDVEESSSCGNSEHSKQRGIDLREMRTDRRGAKRGPLSFREHEETSEETIERRKGNERCKPKEGVQGGSALDSIKVPSAARLVLIGRIGGHG